jgi:hypothetical protein
MVGYTEKISVNSVANVHVNIVILKWMYLHPKIILFLDAVRAKKPRLVT